MITPEERRKTTVEIWKAVVNVQMHFNDIEMRIRAMFVTIVLALFASIGFLLDKSIYLNLYGIRISFYTVIPVFGIFGSWLFYFIDRYWYHRLLVGSVKHAISIENKYKSILPELSLSDAIGAASPYNPRLFTRLIARVLVSDKRFVETGLLHSDGKIELFYKSVMLIMGVVALVLAFAGGIQFGSRNEGAATTKSPEAPQAHTAAPPAASSR